MSTGITASRIQQEPALLGRTAVATGGGAGDGCLFREITRRLPGEGLSDLNPATLTRLLREAERIMANTNLLLRSNTDLAGTPDTLSRVRAARRAKTHPKTAGST
jgi:hypothetical protein